MASVLEVVDRVGPSEANILITGENGTGKGLIAGGQSASGLPLVAVNIDSLSGTLFRERACGSLSQEAGRLSTREAAKYLLAHSAEAAGVRVQGAGYASSKYAGW